MASASIRRVLVPVDVMPLLDSPGAPGGNGRRAAADPARTAAVT
jgi:hypothetical protein